jgi:deazaflavin-dependent oxidoreductase (nitroreductase family)
MAKPVDREFNELQERILDVSAKAMSKLNTWIFKATDGRLGNKFLRGAPVLLLTTTGRKTGELRTTPLIYLADGERMVLVASKGGSKRHPLWYRNLEAYPDVEVQIGRDRIACRSRTASPEEKKSLWPRLLQIYRDYDDYQARTSRDIPVVILDPHST